MWTRPNGDGAGEPLLRLVYGIEGNDFVHAGDASTRIKDVLKELQLPPAIVRRAAICAYEAEMNVVMYARRGVMTLEVHPGEVMLHVQDEGQGIPDIALALQEGWSTATEDLRERGFGAGMGLPNIHKCADQFKIRSEVGKGTQLCIAITLT